MGHGDSVVMVGNEWSDDHRSPKSLGGKNTQSVHVQLGAGEDIDAHCDRARAAGAAIIAAPETQFYGDRTYRARDPEGHIWTFGVTVEAKTRSEEHTSELQSLMRISYAVFCLKKKTSTKKQP